MRSVAEAIERYFQAVDDLLEVDAIGGAPKDVDAVVDREDEARNDVYVALEPLVDTDDDGRWPWETGYSRAEAIGG